MNQHPKGWLTNLERKKRRDNSKTLTPEHVQKMLNRIDSIPEYIKPTIQRIDGSLGQLMRLRDKALISLNWIWFKRASEVLGLKRKDTEVTERELIVTFTIRKKKRRIKICPECDEINGFKNSYCRKCSQSLKDAEALEQGEEKTIPKRKTLQYKFTKPIVEWIDAFDSLTPDREAWLFPPLQCIFDYAFFDFHRIRTNKRTGEPYNTSMSVQNYDKILQRLDPTMTSSMFRYGHTERLLVLGYTPSELKSIGDWDSSRMPEIYAERKDLSPAQRRFAEDTR